MMSYGKLVAQQVDLALIKLSCAQDKAFAFWDLRSSPSSGLEQVTSCTAPARTRSPASVWKSHFYGR
ncbi:hypothetical protein NECAME_08456 [Necator americanus]|uniref:Uncharacterized protein n=1 Tax=Necator americanus TaxID=51031 RepID=W2THJ8_NECAM|nr:hypothetical protein NECAME_08456 [Necator americanus]ETN81545.1 hypothetical protein NECAME_08456 [Necator americanus]